MSDDDKPMGNTADQPSQPAPEAEAAPFTPFTLEERISQLCEIDKVLTSTSPHETSH